MYNGIGKYNAGQKGVYWSQILLILVLLTTGLTVWQQPGRYSLGHTGILR